MSNFFYDYMTEAEREAEIERIQDEHDLKRIQYAFEAAEMAHQVRLSDIETKAICENYTDDELELAYSRELEIYTEGVGDLINKLIEKLKNIWYSITGQTDKIKGVKVDSDKKVEVEAEPGTLVKIMESIADLLKNWFGWYKTEDNGEKKPNWVGITLTSILTLGAGGALTAKIAKHQQMLNEIRSGERSWVMLKEAPRWVQAIHDAGKKINDQIDKFKDIKDDENTGNIKKILLTIANGAMTVAKGVCNVLSNGVAAVTGSVFDDFDAKFQNADKPKENEDSNDNKDGANDKEDSSEGKEDTSQTTKKAIKQKKEAEKHRKNVLSKDEQKMLNSKQAQITKADFAHLINKHSYGPGCKVKEDDDKHFIDIRKYKKGNKIKIVGRQYSELFALFKRHRKVIDNEYINKFSIYEKIVKIYAKLDNSTAPTTQPAQNPETLPTENQNKTTKKTTRRRKKKADTVDPRTSVPLNPEDGEDFSVGESAMWTEVTLSDDGEIETISMYVESYSDDGSKVTTITEYASDEYDEYGIESLYESSEDEYDESEIESIYESYEDQLTSLNDLIDLL